MVLHHVRIEIDNNLGFGQIQLGLGRSSECFRRTLHFVDPANRFPGVDFCTFGRHAPHGVPGRRRSGDLGQDRHLLGGALEVFRFNQEIFPGWVGGRATIAMNNSHAAVGIVKVKNTGLSKCTGGALAQFEIRVPVNFDGTAVVTCGQHRQGNRT